MNNEVTIDSVFEVKDLRLDQNKKFHVLPKDKRDEALEIMNQLNFPTTRNEAWKYTRVAKIRNSNFSISDQETIDSVSHKLIPGLDGSLLVFVNGFYKAELSNIVPETGLSISPLSDLEASSWSQKHIGTVITDEKEEFFSAMNNAYASDGVAIKIDKNTAVKDGIQVLFISTGENIFASTRKIIVCEDFSKAHLTIEFFSEDATNCFHNTATEIIVGKNAQITIDKIQNENPSALSVSTERVKQHQDSTFYINTITLDGGLVRNNLTIDVAGQNCETNMAGVYILSGKQHVDNYTIVDHQVANCNSNELYKGVMSDESTGVFSGKVFVQKDAQKINAFQSNGNVLIGKNASVNSKPALEIYADDVKCSHGSTTGQLDEEAIFYLRARGMSETSARALMVSAFIMEALEKVENESVRAYIDHVLLEKFGWEF